MTAPAHASGSEGPISHAGTASAPGSSLAPAERGRGGRDPLVTWTARGRRFGHAEVFAAIAALSFLVARFVPVLAIPFTCPLKGIAGIPCATCGMTHAFVHLAHGEVARAVAASPLGAALAAGAWLYAALDLARVAAGAPFPSPGARLLRAVAAAGVVALLANWAWLVAVTV